MSGHEIRPIWLHSRPFSHHGRAAVFLFALVGTGNGPLDQLPLFDDWKVYGPLGLFFLFCLGVAWDYYRGELKLRAKQAREQAKQAHESNERRQEEAHQAHIGFVNTTATCLPEIKDTLKMVVLTQGQHGEDIAYIKKHIRPCRSDNPSEPPNTTTRPS